MYYYPDMQATFEAEKNRKAFTYTVMICIILLLLAIFIRWSIFQPPVPVIPDLIEVNLGNDLESYGKVQPLIKGEMSSKEPVEEIHQRSSIAKDQASKDIEADESNDKDAAPVVKPIKPNPKSIVITKNPLPIHTKSNNPTPVIKPTPKPQKPLITYKGSGNGNGNGATENNDQYNEGNNPNGHGDYGTSTGKPDSYGDTPGGKSGGPRIIRGDRKIIRYYSFTDNLDKATVNAIIKVSADGKGSFAGFDKGSSTRSQAYANAIEQHLSQIQFDKSDHDSFVTVQFNFNVN
jgi:hypothetical protein